LPIFSFFGRRAIIHFGADIYQIELTIRCDVAISDQIQSGRQTTLFSIHMTAKLIKHIEGWTIPDEISKQRRQIFEFFSPYNKLRRKARTPFAWPS
jgi:hypothetical protein